MTQSLAEQLALSILRRLKSAGYEAFICGGAPRDLKLGRVPKDFDVCTNAVPPTLVKLFPHADLVGASFGVILVKGDGVTVEVATYRVDGEYLDGRRPESVRFVGSVEADVQRRDFTVNGLLLDPTDGDWGVIDHVGGLADLQNKVIRAIGNPADRFREDHLRMLRAVRFAARLDFAIDSATLQAIKDNAHHLPAVATERIRDEFTRILMEGDAHYGIRLLELTGLLHYILPEFEALAGCTQPPEFHPEGDVREHVLKILSVMGKPQSLPVALAVLLHDIAKPQTRTVDADTGRIRFNGHAEKGAEMAREILTRLKYPNDVIDLVVDMIAIHMDFPAAEKMRKSTFKRFVGRPQFDQYMELHRLDSLGGLGESKLGSYNFIRERMAEMPPEVIRPARLVSGRELIALGYTPGPLFKAALLAAETAQLEETITTPAEALAVAVTVLNGN